MALLASLQLDRSDMCPHPPLSSPSQDVVRVQRHPLSLLPPSRNPHPDPWSSHRDRTAYVAELFVLSGDAARYVVE